MEVKFRLWCDNKKEWEKDEWYLNKNGKIIDAKRQIEMKKETHFLSQSTGLLDKNGVEIYGGDIVKNEYEKLGLVRYENGALIISNTCGWFKKDHGLQFEVIGNIYDNPELLAKQ